MDSYHAAYEITNPLQGGPLYLAVMGLLNSEWFVWFNWILGFVLLIAFFAYCLSKEGRDERGRAIIGTACLYGVAVLVVLINIMAIFSNSVITNLAIFSNAIRVVFNGFFITMLVSIAVLRKIR